MLIPARHRDGHDEPAEHVPEASRRWILKPLKV
jgi:hypothetical protein